MKRYILLHVHENSSDHYKYVPFDFRFNDGGIEYPPKSVYFTRWGAVNAINKANNEARKYPSLYGIAPFKWSWDLLELHPEYAEYLKEGKQWEKAYKAWRRLPASLRDDRALPPKPQKPAGTVGAIPKTTMSTPSDHDALVLKVTKLEMELAVVSKHMSTLTEICDEELGIQKKAIIALGDIIKGMDDRLEDLEGALRAARRS